MNDDDFRYAEQLETVLAACPLLRSVEPESTRIFLAGYIMAKEYTIADLREQLAKVRPLLRLVSVTDHQK